MLRNKEAGADNDLMIAREIYLSFGWFWFSTKKGEIASKKKNRLLTLNETIVPRESAAPLQIFAPLQTREF